jgi:hypothetical protein
LLLITGEHSFEISLLSLSQADDEVTKIDRDNEKLDFTIKLAVTGTVCRSRLCSTWWFDIRDSGSKIGRVHASSSASICLRVSSNGASCRLCPSSYAATVCATSDPTTLSHADLPNDYRPSIDATFLEAVSTPKSRPIAYAKPNANA